VTIAISLKVNDGVVLAADSASTLVIQGQGAPQVVNVYNNANKIFNLVKGLPIGVVTYGAGSIDNTSISTLIKDFRRTLTDSDDGEFNPKHYTIHDVADRLRRFVFDERYPSAFSSWPEKPLLGFIVAGYSSDQPMAEEYKLETVNGNCPDPQQLYPLEATGVTWSGEGEAIQRLLMGFGTGLPQVLQDNLGVPGDQVGPAIEVIKQALGLYILWPAMPLQDAIDVAEFLVDLTIKTSRFAPGAPTVGGPIETAAISKHEGFKWISRKHYYSREYNLEEGP